jgi:hypothetical protein
MRIAPWLFSSAASEAKYVPVGQLLRSAERQVPAAICRHPPRPESSEIRAAYCHAERLGLEYEVVTFDRHTPERYARVPGI